MEKLNNLPKFLIEKLENQYGKELTEKILEGYEIEKNVTLRVNTLKSTKKEVEEVFRKEKIDFEFVDWYDDAFIIKNVKESFLQKLDIYIDGKIYLQSLSSMLPPIILEPKENMDILDMCAAPGGKTSELATLCLNKVNLTACEISNIRYEKLKYNMEKQGVRNINIMKKDSRFLDDFFSFDSILLDSPCSGSGTIDLNSASTYKNFSIDLVKKSCKLQNSLLRKALKLLKKGHEMVYSTCSILSEENEDIIKNILQEGNIEIIPIDDLNVPMLPSKIKGTLCVMPNYLYEGFFVAKIRKIK